MEGKLQHNYFFSFFALYVCFNSIVVCQRRTHSQEELDEGGGGGGDPISFGHCTVPSFLQFFL